MINRKGTIPILKNDLFRKTYFGLSDAESKLGNGWPSKSDFEIINLNLLRKISPHRLDFHLIFFVTDGEANLTLGTGRNKIQKNTIGFVGPNTIVEWQAAKNVLSGWFLAFAEHFYLADFVDKQFLNELSFFQVGNPALMTLNESQSHFYFAIFEMMASENSRWSEYSSNIIRGLLHTLLHKSRTDYTRIFQEVVLPPSSALQLLRGFTKMYMHDISIIRTGKPIELRKLSDYANALSVTPGYLNDSVKKLTGHSASQLIGRQLVKQATMCLLTSDKSISEIAYLLGFEDSSYFSRFYRSHMGQSPTQYRKLNREMYQSIRIQS